MTKSSFLDMLRSNPASKTKEVESKESKDEKVRKMNMSAGSILTAIWFPFHLDFCYCIVKVITIVVMATRAPGYSNRCRWFDQTLVQPSTSSNKRAPGVKCRHIDQYIVWISRVIGYIGSKYLYLFLFFPP